ncbi:MAG: VanZ family protein [Bacilli bacterium]|nr:VanZ family protein [Bacilli bacterium]
MNQYFTNTVHDIINSTLPMVIVTVIVLVTIRLIYLLKNKEHITWYKEIFMLTFVVYILCLFQIVTVQDTVSWSTNNFVPFKEILRYDIGSALFFKNIIGNILLFLPFGFFVGYIIKSKDIILPLIICIVCSISVETVQLYIGRVFDVDDIILNVIGGLAGYFVYRIVHSFAAKLPKAFRSEIFLNIITIALFIGITYLLIVLL